MDKKIRMAFSGFLHGKRRAENAGEKPAIYTAPEVEICAYAPEKGFALSTMIECGQGTPELEQLNEIEF